MREDWEGRGSVAAAATAWMACVAFAFWYAYDAPYWDEWVYVTPVARAFEGELSLADFWVRVNEHIYVVSSLIAIPLARMTHWNLRYEVACILAFYTATFVFLVASLVRADRIGLHTGSRWAVFPISILIFSFSQHALWNWGLHLGIATAVFFLLASLWMLSQKRVNPAWVGGGCLLAWAATFSIGGGLSVWPAGAILLALRRDIPLGRRLAYGAAWLAAGGAASAVYLWSGDNVPSDAAERATDPLAFAAYLVAYLGGPLSPYDGRIALAAGFIFVALFGVWAVRRLTGGATDPGRAAFRSFVFGLASVGATVGVLTALKHAHEGVDNAISSRFLPWPTLSWCALVLGVYEEFPRLSAAPRWVQVGVGAVTLSILAGSGLGVYVADERHDAFLIGRRALIEGEEAGLEWLHPDPARVVALRPFLVEHRLTVFRDTP